jgi:hypothetical protein
MIITDELRAKILLHLPNDYQSQGSKETGYSRSMIYKVLHEKQDNHIIAKWLINKAKELKLAKEKADHKLSKIALQL